jgi:hypothetical protein
MLTAVEAVAGQAQPVNLRQMDEMEATALNLPSMARQLIGLAVVVAQAIVQPETGR